MRIVLAIIAAFVFSISVASAGSVGSTFGSTNLKSTDWAAMDCNGTQTILQCTLNGGEGDGGPDKGADGDGEGGKH